MKAYLPRIADSMIAERLSYAGAILVGEDTIYSYIDALSRIFVVENVGAWTPSIRAKTAIRS